MQLTKNQIKSTKEAATYIRKLPPEEWVGIRQIIEPWFCDYWDWLGKSIDAFFSDDFDPLIDSNLSEIQQAVIRCRTNEYLQLSILLFQAEKFIRKELKEQNIKFNWKRSELLKVWALEECCYSIFVLLQDDWESLSAAQREEQSRTVLKYFKGELSEIPQATLRRWETEESKIHRVGCDEQTFAELMPSIYFFYGVFLKYRRQLPAFESWMGATLKSLHVPGKGKFRILNQQICWYPGRGQGSKS